MNEFIKQKLCLIKYRLDTMIKMISYKNSTDVKILRSWKDKYKGQRCFIVGNGPSLNIYDLEKLKGEVTFAFNRIYYIFDKTDWRPTFYSSVDLKLIKNSLQEINNLNFKYKFLPLVLKNDYGINAEGAIYINQTYKKDNKELPRFSEDITKCIEGGNTVTYTAIQMAVYMGFKKIYLIGVDHNCSRNINKNGNLIKNKNIKDYFCEEYNKDNDRLYIPKINLSTLAYIKAEEYSQNSDFKIYNATRGGKLEVFERVDFDELFC